MALYGINKEEKLEEMEELQEQYDTQKKFNKKLVERLEKLEAQLKQ
ncbi:hypothetical protein [Aquimarina pacifica]|nr:hypothetical protein [Aquimarina pacifica]